MSESLKSELEEKDISIFPLFYTDIHLSSEHTLRVYQKREKVNLIDVLTGKELILDHEIAIDRLYAKNKGLEIGDTIDIDQQLFTISGLTALSDYSALFKNNSDMMLDANRFCVAVVCPDDFLTLAEDHMTYCYAWTYQENLSEELKKRKMRI